jgi:hypothetical protein
LSYIKFLHEWGTPTLEKSCIGLSSNKYMYNILKKIIQGFQLMKLTYNILKKIIQGLSINEINKNTWNNGNTHTGTFLQGTIHSYYF